MIIRDWDGPNTGFKLIKTVAYHDTVALKWRAPPPGKLLTELWTLYGKQVRLGRHYLPKTKIARWVLTIHQPRSETLYELDALG